jgi:hypothetical protein
VEGDHIFDELVCKSDIHNVADRIASDLHEVKDAYQNSVNGLVNLAVELGIKK